MGENQAGVNEGVKGRRRVTITEAASLLNVHPNTVRNRVKAGIYEAEKVFTENGFTWMIDRDSLVNDPLPKDPHQSSSQVVSIDAAAPVEIVQDLLRPFVDDLGRAREELGAERVRREQAERERDELAERLKALAESRDALEQAPEAKAADDEQDAQPAPQRSWLYRLFFGQ